MRKKTHTTVFVGPVPKETMGFPHRTIRVFQTIGAEKTQLNLPLQHAWGRAITRNGNHRAACRKSRDVCESQSPDGNWGKSILKHPKSLVESDSVFLFSGLIVYIHTHRKHWKFYSWTWKYVGRILFSRPTDAFLGQKTVSGFKDQTPMKLGS